MRDSSRRVGTDNNKDIPMVQMNFKQELDICVIISKKEINNGQRQNAGEVANYKILHTG
jgi:hypothetical protein